jgi:hypothetical protein
VQRRYGYLAAADMAGHTKIRSCNAQARAPAHSELFFEPKRPHRSLRSNLRNLARNNPRNRMLACGIVYRLIKATL